MQVPTRGRVVELQCAGHENMHALLAWLVCVHQGDCPWAMLPCPWSVLGEYPCVSIDWVSWGLSVPHYGMQRPVCCFGRHSAPDPWYESRSFLLYMCGMRWECNARLLRHAFVSCRWLAFLWVYPWDMCPPVGGTLGGDLKYIYLKICGLKQTISRCVLCILVFIVCALFWSLLTGNYLGRAPIDFRGYHDSSNSEERMPRTTALVCVGLYPNVRVVRLRYYI